MVLEDFSNSNMNLKRKKTVQLCAPLEKRETLITSIMLLLVKALGCGELTVNTTFFTPPFLLCFDVVWGKGVRFCLVGCLGEGYQVLFVWMFRGKVLGFVCLVGFFWGFVWFCFVCVGWGFF